MFGIMETQTVMTLTEVLGFVSVTLIGFACIAAIAAIREKLSS